MIKPFLPLLILLCTSTASACNIPVFRYALERWQRDALSIYVFSDRELTGKDAAFVASLESSAQEAKGHANLRVVRSSVHALGDANSPAAKLWQSLQQAKPAPQLPYMVVRTPLGGKKHIDSWHGTLRKARRASLLDSPARRELRQRLLTGHAVVWLVSKSADAKRNEAARGLLDAELKSLAKRIELPDGIGLPGSELYSEVPLLLKFSVLEIDAKDQHEQYLAKLLSALQPDAHARGEPLLVPVFGRGRALEVVPLKDANARLLHDLTVFLSGACSCRVKELNPGFDLLITANWDRDLFGEGGVRPPTQVGARKNPDDKPTYLNIPPGRKK